MSLLLLLLSLLFTKYGNAPPEEGEGHSISPMIPAPQYKHVEINKRNGKSIDPALKTRSPTPDIKRQSYPLN